MPMSLPVAISEVGITPPGKPYWQRVFAHATETIGSGSFPHRWAGFFFYFSYPPRKVKGKI